MTLKVLQQDNDPWYGDGLGFTPGLAVADGLVDLVDWAREQHAVDDVARATSELADRGLVR